MEASLDTDIVIHLYNSGMESILWNMFDTLYLFEYLYHNELFHKTKDPVWEAIEKDIDNGKIVYVDESYLTEIGFYDVFEEVLEEYRITMDSGENYAYALGKILGCHVLTTDDTKNNGPHDLLMKSINSSIVPLAYYELFYLEYLLNDMSPLDMIKNCKRVNSKAFEYPMSLESRLKNVLRRFGDSIIIKDRTLIIDYLKIDESVLKTKNKELQQAIRQHF